MSGAAQCAWARNLEASPTAVLALPHAALHFPPQGYKSKYRSERFGLNMELVLSRRRSPSAGREGGGEWWGGASGGGGGGGRGGSASPQGFPGSPRSSATGSDVVHWTSRRRRRGGRRGGRGVAMHHGGGGVPGVGGDEGGDGGGGDAGGEAGVWEAFEWWLEKELYPPLRRVWPGRLR